MRLFLSACSGRSCSDWLKMSLLPLALLLVAGVLSSAEAQSSFSKLPDSYKKGVELAEQNLNAHEGVQHHFLFFKTIQQSQIEVNLSLCFLFVFSLSDCFLRDLTRSDVIPTFVSFPFYFLFSFFFSLNFFYCSVKLYL